MVTRGNTHARLIRVLVFTAMIMLSVTTFGVREFAGRQWAARTGRCEAAFRARRAGKDPAGVGVSVRVVAPRFEIAGAPGFYREKTPGYCLVKVTGTGPARIEFTAAPLYSLRRGKDARLNAVYWVDWPEKEFWSFRPGGPPLILPITGDTQRFNIYGGVAINEISKQPAGEYRGSITATVFSY